MPTLLLLRSHHIDTEHIHTGQIKRAIREHDTLDLMEDLVRCGIISGGKQTGDFFTQHLAGGVLDDTMKKYWDGALANETAENTS